MRATSGEIEKLGDFVDIDDLTPFITLANQMVTDVCLTSGYTEGKLTLIENWLAAHFAKVANPPERFEGVGKVQVSYESKIGLGLDLTRWGQTVKVIDDKGNLARLDARSRFENAGKLITPSIQHLGAVSAPEDA
jgi:hypothetical protein